MERLRLVIFTTATLSSYNDVLFRRLLATPEIEVAAIILDEFPWRSVSLRRRIEKHGLGYLPYILRKKTKEYALRKLWRWWERDHPRRPVEPNWQRLAAETGVVLHRTPDLHCEGTRDFIHGLQTDLGMICGGRIIREQVLTIPKHGTLNIHKRKVPDYRGGGAIGYWELLNGEKEIGVTIHYAVAKVDEGAVLGQQLIPIEPYDTLHSLHVKSSVAGNNLYYDVVRRFARGEREGRQQDLTRGRTYRGAGQFAEYQLEQSIRNRRLAAYKKFGAHRDYFASPMLWLKYLLAKPALRRRRQELAAAGQAPIIVLFWHRVANDAANPGTLPLEAFIEQVFLLRRYFPIISLDEAQRRLENGRNDETAVVLSFDDGYAADLQTSIPWLRYFGIPATWFVSVGNTIEGRAYNHDEKRGIDACRPMTIEELRGLPDSVISVGSHCWLHEDCGKLTGEPLRVAICRSKSALGELLGAPPRHFAFPKGIKGVNIKREGWELAAAEYETVSSAYSGYNFPRDGAKHIKRWGNPYTGIGLLPLLDGFSGLGDWRRGNLWTWDTANEPPY